VTPCELVRTDASVSSANLPSSRFLSTLKIEAKCYSETSVPITHGATSQKTAFFTNPGKSWSRQPRSAVFCLRADVTSVAATNTLLPYAHQSPAKITWTRSWWGCPVPKAKAVFLHTPQPMSLLVLVLVLVPPASTCQTPHSAHTVYLCVPYGSHSKQRLFPHTALTGWAL
jgi:hypothetical protein